MRLLIWILLLFSACEYKAQKYLSAINDVSDFQLLAGEPLNQNIRGAQSIKVVHDIKSGKLFFINGRLFSFHYEFCKDQLNYSGSVSQYNAENYNPDKGRDYLLCNLNFSYDKGLYFIDLSVFDQMSFDQLKLLYSEVCKQFKISKKIHVLVNSQFLEKIQEENPAAFSYLSVNDLFSKVAFQIISQAKTSGKILFLTKDQLDTAHFKGNEILLLDFTPEWIPLVSGLIMSEFQTPLSHLSILGSNRNIPIVVLEESRFKQAKNLVGSTQQLHAFKDGYTLKPSTELSPPSKPKSIELKMNLKVKNLILVDKIMESSPNTVGSKACNFGQLYKWSKSKKFKVPENAFAIPFYFYSQHICASNAIKQIDFLEKNGASLSEDSIAVLLKNIRKSIKKASIDSYLIREIEKQFIGSKFTNFRFRSSTNAEDVRGFSGAGLYDSKTVIRGDSIKTITRALHEVWASLWTEKAYWERRYFGISDHNLCMGVLVHRAFPTELANGVLISNNVYRNGLPGLSINVQKGDISVVIPPKNVTCDELIVYPESQMNDFQFSIEFVNRSNQSNKAILTETQIKELASIGEYLENNFFANSSEFSLSKEKFAIDIEFKITEDGIYVKQVRPY